MKKTILIFIILSLFFLGCATQQQATSEEMNHTFILNYPGVSKNVLFEKTIKWIGINFRSAKATIDVKDKEAGSIIAKGFLDNVDYGGLINGNCFFTLMADIKEGKERLIFVPNSIRMMDVEQSFSDASNMHRGVQKEFIKMETSLDNFIKEKDEF